MLIVENQLIRTSMGRVPVHRSDGQKLKLLPLQQMISDSNSFKLNEKQTNRNKKGNEKKTKQQHKRNKILLQYTTHLTI